MENPKEHRELVDLILKRVQGLATWSDYLQRVKFPSSWFDASMNQLIAMSAWLDTLDSDLMQDIASALRIEVRYDDESI